MNIRSFIIVFAIPELKAILSQWKGIMLLFIVVLVSFLSIGFSSGSEEYLKNKMDSPFVKFLGIELPYFKAQNSEFIDTLSFKLDRPEIKAKYHVTKYGFVSYWMPYFASIDNKTTLAKVRAIETDNDLYRFIFENDLIVSPRAENLETAQWSIIVTTRYLKKLGYKEGEYPAYLNYVLGFSRGDTKMPIPIAAVVSQLPNECDIFVTWKLYQAFEGRYGDSNPLYPDQAAYFGQKRFFIPEANKMSVQSQLTSLPSSIVTIQEETFADGVIAEFKNSDESIDLLIELEKLFGKGVTQIYNFDAVGYSVETERGITYDNLVVQFDDLDSLSGFERLMLAEPLGLTIDMNAIEARNNFLLFSKISRVLSSVLSLLSISFIITFLTRTITEHIDRNAKNLGTLKAFGLSNKSIAWTYSGVSGTLVLGIFISALTIAGVIGNPLTNLILNNIGIELTNGNQMFKLEVDLLMLIYFVVVPIALITTILYFKIRKQTPGDLIYER